MARVSIEDGSRTKEEMDDRAANYIFDSNLIKVVGADAELTQ